MMISKILCFISSDDVCYFFTALFGIVESFGEGTSALAHRLCFVGMARDVAQLLLPARDVAHLEPEAAALRLDVHRHLWIASAQNREAERERHNDGRQSHCIVAPLAADADAAASGHPLRYLVWDGPVAVVKVDITLRMQALEVRLAFPLGI